MSFDLLLISTSATRTASQAVETILKHVRSRQWQAFDVGVACTAIWILLRYLRISQRVRTTELRGPPSESFLYGVGRRTLDPKDVGAVYEAWAQEYGPVYAAPSGFGQKRIILCDPKALAHYYANDTWTYAQTPFARKATALFFGKGIIWSQGEDHKRQRKSLTPAFSIAAVRQLTSIFYDSAYKAKGAWDLLIESNAGDSTIIDVQDCSRMNHISLDTIGLAGFSYDFATLEGKHADVAEVFDEFNASPRGEMTLNSVVMTLGLIFPFLARIPTERNRLFWKLNTAMEDISKVLLARTQKELEMGTIEGKEEKSIIGSLIKGASADSDYHLTPEEVISQMKLLILAGYETTSISLSWALLELARNKDVQTKLRNELLRHGSDPTYDQLSNSLPYLDAVVHEIFRVHSPVTELTRIATKDDIIPLSQPIHTKSGELVDTLMIAKGTLIGISVEGINRSAAFWGEDAKIFCPSRWLEEGENGGIPLRAKEIQGHRHLLTFSEGPRMCLGKHFAVAEFKTVLTVLVKSFVFELRDGVNTKIEIGRGVLPRPTIAGEVGCKLPLRVRPYAG